MDEELYEHPLIEPLVRAGPEVPVEAIETLSRSLRKSRALAARVNRLFRFETSFNPEEGGYLVVWLAFALALARNEEALHSFMDLFELVDPIEHDMLWELAQFALWQYGDTAVRAVLGEFDRVLEIDHTGYFLGVLEVAGSSGDQLLRRRVSDRVLAALQSNTIAPPLVLNLLDIALILGDPRLPGILEGWKKCLPPDQRRLMEEIENLLLDDLVEEAARDHRRPWQELAALAAEHFTSHMASPPASAPGGTEDLDDLLEREYQVKLRLLVDAWDARLDDFMDSPFFRRSPAEIRRASKTARNLLWDICRIAAEEFEVLLEDLDPEEVGKLMEEVLPRRLAVAPERFAVIPDLLVRFYRYMADEDWTDEEAEVYEVRIRRAVPLMHRRAADPACWDREKKEVLKESE